MSTYYNYYIGEKREGKIYPLGPYDREGKLHSVFWRCGSLGSELNEHFNVLPDNLISDELRKEFEYTSWDGNKHCDLQYLDFEKLPSTDFIRTGYFLIEDVIGYEKYGMDDDLFLDYMTPTAYAGACNNEKIFGPPKQKYDDEGKPIEQHSASEFMYYAYPNYQSTEYESFLLYNAADSLREDHENLVFILMID